MKKSDLLTFFVAGFLFVMGLSAQAAPIDGGNSGGGGDIRCAEYSDLVGKIVSTLHGSDPENVAKELHGLDVKVLLRVKKNLKCFPVQELNRQAFSYPQTVTTKLLASSWEEMTYPEKVRLATHELCVLAGYEFDGQYALSQKIMQYLVVPLAIYGRQNFGILYSDGSTAFQFPNAEGAWVRGSTIQEADSLCKYLGMGRALKFEVKELKTKGLAIGFGYKDPYIYVPFATIQNGELVSIERDPSEDPETLVEVFSVLVCGRGRVK